MARSLRPTILKYSLSILFLSMTITALWIVWITWYGAHEGGKSWAAGSANASQTLLKHLKQNWKLRGDALEQNTAEELSQKLECDELVMIFTDPEHPLIFRSPKTEAWNFDVEPKDVFRIESEGYYLLNHHIFFVDVRKPRKWKRKKFVILKHLDDEEFLNAFKATSMAEILFVSATETLDSTFLNNSGKKILPEINSNLRKVLFESKAIEIQPYSDLLSLSVPNYQGFTIPSPDGTLTYHRNANHITVYASFFPISNSDGERVAAMGILIPENALLNGPKKGLWGSLVLLILITSISGIALSRFAGTLIRPLSAATKKVEDLSKEISSQLEIPLEIDTEPEGVHTTETREIQALGKATQRLEKAYRKAEQLRKAIDEQRGKAFIASKMATVGEMASGIAHEINTPLAVIAMLIEQIHSLADEDQISREELKALTAKVETTTFRIAKIIKGMSAFSRDGEQDPFLAVSLKQILEDCQALCSERFSRIGAELEIDELSKDLFIECRSTQIFQVLLNLLNNSRDAIENLDEKWVKISIKDCGDTVELRISDSGKGIPAEVHDKLFSPFFTTKGVGKGTGLGLSISEKLVKTHGGSLKLDPHAPSTCFVLQLPKFQSSLETLAA